MPRKKPNKGPRKRPVPARVLARVAFAMDLRAEGKRFGYIARELMERYRICRSSAEHDIALCDAKIAEELEKNMPSIRARFTNYLEMMAGMAIDQRDVKGLVMVAGEMREWAQLGAGGGPIGSTVNVNDPSGLIAALKLTPAERKAREAKLMEELGEEDLGAMPAGATEPSLVR